jgi:hypothetical protein
MQECRVHHLKTNDFFACYARSIPKQRETRLSARPDADRLALDDQFLSKSIPGGAGALLQSLIQQSYKLCRGVIVTSNRVLQMGRLPPRQHHRHHYPGPAHAS